jgi:hypothetical protein
MTNKFNCFLLLFFLSCKSSNSTDHADTNKEHENNTASNSAVSKNVSLKDTTGFLKDCDKLLNGVSIGGLQGVNVSKDSLGFFCFYECYDCKKTFRIVLAYKEFSKRRDFNFIKKELDEDCMEHFKNFEGFAFVYPLRNPDKQKNTHEINFDLPATVRVYERIEKDRWKFLKTVKVNSFEEYALLEFKTIYHRN